MNLNRDQSIRNAALMCAVRQTSTRPAMYGAGAVVEMAEIFEAYIRGDEDDAPTG